MRAQRTRAFVTSSVLAKRTVGDGWSRSGVVGGSGGIGCGVYGKHVLQRGDSVAAVDDDADRYKCVQPRFVLSVTCFFCEAKTQLRYIFTLFELIP